jgi:acyl carrier protein
MIDAIRHVVFEEHGILTYAVILVTRGSLPKSSELGKLNRSACRTAFISGKLEAIKVSTMGDDYPDYSRGPRFVAPRTSTEKKLADIWCSILDVRKIGIYDNFVDLGGHSILATQCLNCVRDSFGVELPLTMLFADTGNVRELSEILDKLMATKDPSPDLGQNHSVAT